MKRYICSGAKKLHISIPRGSAGADDPGGFFVRNALVDAHRVPRKRVWQQGTQQFVRIAQICQASFLP